MYSWGEISEIDQWWRDGANGICPGKMVLFFGAGVSMPAPTNLPGGGDLTTALVDHLLDSDGTYFLEAFRATQAITTKGLPRLEHILEAVEKAHEMLPDEPESPRNLLKMFGNRPPNGIHKAIADYLIQNRAWAITTNFDDCVEKAADGKIPVHIYDPDEETIKTIHREGETEWGLLKLHGTIAQGVAGLGASLKNLVPGLSLPFRSLLDRIFSSADVVAVAGYSGSDYFDVNEYLREKLNTRSDTKLLWLHHCDEADYDHESEHLDDWKHAFAGYRGRFNDTSENLYQLMGRSEPRATMGKPMVLADVLSDLYIPSKVIRHAVSAQLFTAVGLNQKAHIAIELLRHETGNSDMLSGLKAEVYCQEGRWLSAYVAKRHENMEAVIHDWAHISNISGRHLLSFILYGLILPRESKRQPDVYLETARCLCDLYKNSWLARVLAFTVGKDRVNKRLLELIKKSKEAIGNDQFWIWNPTLQLLFYQREACFGDLPEDEVFGFLLKIYEQLWPPDLYVEGVPVYPGLRMTMFSTPTEADRIHDYVLAVLRVVDVYTVFFNKHWKRDSLATRFINNCLRSLFRGSQNRSELDPRVKSVVYQMRRLLDDAETVATALGNDFLRDKVAKSRLRTSYLVGGFVNWPESYYVSRL